MRRDITDSARGKEVVREGRYVTDGLRLKGVCGERRDVAYRARGKRSVGRDVMLQTVQGGSGRLGEMCCYRPCKRERGCSGGT